MWAHHCYFTVYGGYVIILLWCHSMWAVWAHHCDVTVASQYEGCVSSYCYVTVTSQYEDYVSSSLWCHRNIQVRFQFDATVTSQYENFVTSSVWCHCDIQMRLQYDVAVTSPLWHLHEINVRSLWHHGDLKLSTGIYTIYMADGGHLGFLA